MLVVGLLSYSIVGLMFSIGLISGKQTGKEAYAAVFIIYLIIGYCVYQGIIKLQEWILSWPLVVKIIVPIFVVMLIVGTVIIVFLSKENKD